MIQPSNLAKIPSNTKISKRTCVKMKDEIAAAVVFLTGIVRKSNRINQEQLSRFSDNLAVAMIEKFRNHWYEDRPTKGQGFRCIRVCGDEPRDTTLLKVARRCGVQYSDLRLPIDLTLWVDPHEVSCRFGEKGTHCTLAAFPRKSTSSPPTIVESSSTGSSPVSSDNESSSESDSESNHPSFHHHVNSLSNQSRLYQTYRKSTRHQYQPLRSSQISYVARDKYRWVNNNLIAQA